MLTADYLKEPSIIKKNFLCKKFFEHTCLAQCEFLSLIYYIECTDNAVFHEMEQHSLKQTRMLHTDTQ